MHSLGWGTFMILCAVSIAFFVTLGWYETKRKSTFFSRDKKNQPMTIVALTNRVKQCLYELSHHQMLDISIDEEQYKRRIQQRAELRRVLKDCSTGSIQDKKYVKNLISDVLIRSFCLTENDFNEVIPFEQRQLLTIKDKFEILFYVYQQKFQMNALTVLIEKYNLATIRYDEEHETHCYEITTKHIDHIFKKEYSPLSARQKRDIIVQRIYQHYKGFSVIDDIRDQRIDGVSGGVSGTDGIDSVWIFYQGKSVHLSFLSFGTKQELQRVCQNVYKYNHPGQLSARNGYKINEMQDGSRVVVVRPPFCETWAFFIRKFDIPNATLEQLVTGNNAQLPIELLKYLMKGSRITAITGDQGSGKTTLLMAMIKYIYAFYPLRVQETAFELQLRKMYTRRNILTFRETECITGQQGLDLQKKTDGAVHILGEVASDEVATWMIQMAQVASLFTLFTHHAKTLDDLIFSLRNALLKTGMFHQENIAQEQVVRVIQFNVHLRKNMDGHRYIERITQCLPCDGVDKKYVHKNIVAYENDTYVAVSPMCCTTISTMKQQMTERDVTQFQHFLKQHWEESNFVC